MTSTTYDDQNRITTRTAPGDVKTIETRHLDRQPVSITGNAVIPQFYDYSVDENTQLVVTTTTIGTEGGPRVTSTSRTGTAPPLPKPHLILPARVPSPTPTPMRRLPQHH